MVKTININISANKGTSKTIITTTPTTLTLWYGWWPRFVVTMKSPRLITPGFFFACKLGSGIVPDGCLVKTLGVNQRRKYSEKVTNDSAVILLKKRVES